MNKRGSQSSPSKTEAVKILKACQPLAEKLLAHGVTIELNAQEQKLLLSFEQLVTANYDESQWSYLRVVSGVKLNAVAALNSCLRYFRNSGTPLTYGQL